jgi:nitrous oxidase accessory protein NosD
MQKAAVALTLIAALLLSALAGSQLVNFSAANFFPDPGPDLPRIYIRANGNVEPATAPIERAGNIYRFTSNIALQTIVIQRDNIVLDGSGYLIEGNKSWMGTERAAGNNGIIVEGQHNVTITDFCFARFSVGVRISGSSNIDVVDNSFGDAAGMMNSPSGLVIEDSSVVLIESNNFTGMEAITGSGTNLTIRENILTGGSINLKGTSNIIENNQIETSFEALKIGASDLNIISSNRIVGEVSFLYCSNNEIFGNNITGMRTLPAIGITFGSNNTFFNNRIENKATVIGLTQTVNNTFYANIFPANCSIIVSNFDIQGNVLDAESKFWDNFWEKGTIGNYWSAYTGIDSNGDGIGDTPYKLEGYMWDLEAEGFVNAPAGQDNYPLMKPYDVERNTVVLPQAESFPTMAIVVFLVVAVVALWFFVFKKRKH